MDQMLLVFLLRVGVDLAGSSGCGASKEKSSVWYDLFHIIITIQLISTGFYVPLCIWYLK